MRLRGVSSRFTWLVLSCLAILLLFHGTPAWSQATSNSSIAGFVSDEQGAAVPGAEVRLVDAATSSVITTLTNEAGRYIVANLAPGTYTMTVSKQGFAQFKISAQKVDVGTPLTINAPLKVGATTTTVEVTATLGAELQTTNATVGNTLTAEALALLPNLG